MNPIKTLAAQARRRWASEMALVAACMAALSACGGGGGGQSPSSSGTQPPAQATVTLSATPGSVVAGQAVTLSWSSQNTGTDTCQASGAWSGQLAASGTQQVNTAASTTAYTATYNITCGPASANTSVAVTPAQVNNTVAVTVDKGPAGAVGTFNAPFVSVTVCRPGTTICQTIDHVLVDTGSYGLRVFGPLDASLALPAVTSGSGLPAGECGQFVSGYTWGSVRRADVQLGSEVAASLPIQVMGDAPGGVTAPPSDCASVGANIGTPAALGANGILGVGLFNQDCGPTCAATAISATYYSCSGSVCSPSTMPLAQQVANPVAAFAVDNNGVILSLPSVGAGGTQTLAGTLTFGIGTQANNGLGSATKYAANSYGQFRTSYKGTTSTSSFIDSGSNGLFFSDSSIPKCTYNVDFYCPSSSLALSATVAAYDGTASGTVSFAIDNADHFSADTVAGSIGGPGGGHLSSSFDWGLPFFFGRKVYVGLGSSTASPYWAF